MKAALLRFFIKFARHFSRCGGVVDKDCVLFHGGKGTICANGDGAQIVVIADTSKDEICVFYGICRSGGIVAAELFGPFGRLRCGAIIDRNIVPALGFEMPRHGITHHTETKKSHFHVCHCIIPLDLFISGEGCHNRRAIGRTLLQAMIPVFEARQGRSLNRELEPPIGIAPQWNIADPEIRTGKPGLVCKARVSNAHGAFKPLDPMLEFRRIALFCGQADQVHHHIAKIAGYRWSCLQGLPWLRP